MCLKKQLNAGRLIEKSIWHAMRVTSVNLNYERVYDLGIQEKNVIKRTRVRDIEISLAPMPHVWHIFCTLCLRDD